MEHFTTPFESSELSSERVRENRRFFVDLLRRARSHPFFTHPFLGTFERSASRPLAAFVLTTFYRIVSPFTGLLCSLAGRAPDLKTRFALMDNIFEEMGCGDWTAAHPSLYLRMLASIGVSADVAEATPALPIIDAINDHLRRVVEQRQFAVACAVLASAEATIPPSFPVFASGARNAFGAVDMTFFDRHGPRDAGHSDDAALLFAVTAVSAQFSVVDAEVMLDLDYRRELFDVWQSRSPRPLLPPGEAVEIVG
jgi:pyrroloquinoline quinone (PQQ) biosynthesis protein C